jgi:hypothetical protein
LKQDHVETRVASAVMGTGVGKATLGAVIERVAVLVDGGHGRRTAPIAYKPVAVPSRAGLVRGSADKGDADGV